MRISSFHIDGFGLFAGTGVDELGPGLCVFLGSNEAGKSTCMEFLRTMLTGYPDSHNRKGIRRFAPVNGGEPGGSLTLLLDDGANLRITRRPRGMPLALEDGRGPRPPEDLQNLLHGVSRELYRNVFSFSLFELERFESLNSDGVRNALYGASFGTGLRSPAEILKELDKRCDEIFKGNGSKPRLNAALRDLEDLRARISELETAFAGFDQLAHELEAKKEQLAGIRHKRNELENELTRLERSLGVWRQWEEWRQTDGRLARLEVVEDTFPEDGRARLARLAEARGECERQLAAATEKRYRLQQRQNAIAVDANMLKLLPRLRRLAERKSSYRNALAQLPTLTLQCKRYEDEIAGQLAQLGPDWTLGRIRGTDRSLFSREDLEKQARRLTAADLAYQRDLDALAAANREADRAGAAVQAAAEALNLIPSPPAEIHENARDELRQAATRLEEDLRALPQRRTAAEKARLAFMRALDPLGISAADAETELDALLLRQTEAMSLAEAVGERLNAVREALQASGQAEERVNEIKGRMAKLREQQLAADGPTREWIERRAMALRSLRTVSAQLNGRQEHLLELEQRISAAQPAARIKSVPLLIAGIILMSIGAAMLLAHAFFHLEKLDIGSHLSVPLTLWSGYLVLACGVGFLAGGVPRRGPDSVRQEAELEQLKSRLESCVRQVAELGEQARKLKEAAGVDNLDPVTFDAAEMMLQREREQYIQDEQTRRQIDDLKMELEEGRTTHSKRQAAAQEAHLEVQRARKRWHELMQSLGVGRIPSPETAQAFFAGVQGAKQARDIFREAKGASEELDANLNTLIRKLSALPWLAARMQKAENSAPSPESVLEAARAALETCREADAAREQRIRAMAALQNHESERERALGRQTEMAGQLKLSEQAVAAARTDWISTLEGLGLDSRLDPETVRAAFKCMAACLEAENSLENARSELAKAHAEISGLAKPLQEMLGTLGLEAQKDEDDGDDWLATLDNLLGLAEEMELRSHDFRRLATQIEEEEDETRAKSAALEKARLAEQGLLAQGRASDAEDFLRLAALREERRNLERRLEDLEDTLKLAAHGAPLQKFLGEFENIEREELEKRYRDVREEIADFQRQEEELGANVMALGARVANISQDDELGRLRQRRESLLEDMRQLALEWSRLSIARSLLQRAKRKYEQERQPQVMRRASEIFADVTNQRWSGLGASLEDSSLHVRSPRGERIDPAELSRGAQEQAYLSLRLAYIQDHARHAPALPIIMDEVLVNFDSERASRAMRAIARLVTGEIPHQILYFTCHQHIASELLQTVPGGVLYEIGQGKITRAPRMV